MQQSPALPASEFDASRNGPSCSAQRSLPDPSGRLRAIDGLRFLAALYVAAYHYLAAGDAELGWGQAGATIFPALSGVAAYGWLGVEVFFVISGFAICLSCWGRSLGDFFRSRVVRLYPAYWAGVVLTCVVMYVTPAVRSPLSFTDALVNMTMLQEFMGVGNVDGVYWTLTVELRFYLLFALVVWMGLTYRRVVAFSLIWTVAAAVAVAADNSLLYLVAIPKYAPFFLVGVGLYLIYRFGNQLLTWLIIGANAILALHYAVARMDHVAEEVVNQPLQAWVVALVLFGGAAVVLAVANGRLRWVRWRWITYAGALTYPFYLLHDRIGQAAIHWLYMRAGLSAYVVLPVTLIATLTVAWLVHRVVERPLASQLKRHLLSAPSATLDPIDRLAGR